MDQMNIKEDPTIPHSYNNLIYFILQSMSKEENTIAKKNLYIQQRKNRIEFKVNLSKKRKLDTKRHWR